MSSRDFTHELHRTTKTLGYSKVIETLQSMAKIQPSGANDIPTSFRQSRTERDAHDTLGRLDQGLFNYYPQRIEHLAKEAHRYKRRSAGAFSTPHNISSVSESPAVITPEGYRTRHTISYPNPLFGPMNVDPTDPTSRNNVTVGTVFWIYEPPGLTPNTNVFQLLNLAHIDVGYIRMTRIGNTNSDPNIAHQSYQFRSGILGANAGTIYARVPATLGFHHVVLALAYSPSSVPEVSVYFDGAKHTFAPTTHYSAVTSDTYANLTYDPLIAHVNGKMAISEVSQFTSTDPNFDMAAFVELDRAGVRDFDALTSPPSGVFREWYTWPGFSTNLEITEKPDAYS